MHYRMPAGHKPYLPQSTDPTGRVAGLCAVIILAALILMSLLAVDRVASTPAAGSAKSRDSSTGSVAGAPKKKNVISAPTTSALMTTGASADSTGRPCQRTLRSR